MRLNVGTLQDRANDPGNHDLFIGGNNSNCDAALIVGNDVACLCVFGWVEFEAEEVEAVADGGADFGGVFADAARRR